MDSTPLYSYMVTHSPNPIGITLYDNHNQEIGQFLGTDIIDGYVYVHDGTELHTKNMKECFVMEGT